MKCPKTWMTWMLLGVTLGLAACGDDDDATDGTDTTAETTDDTGSDDTTATGACGSLCTTAGFKTADEQNFGEVVECLCAGGTGAIKQADCSSYCAPFGISADKSYLSETTIKDDKCVCDGTGG
jgi:hypothetical protein